MLIICKPVPPQTSTAFKDIYMKKRSVKNSAASAVAGFAGVIDDTILPPAGIKLRNENEHLIWSQFTHAHAKSDWRSMDLTPIAKIVRMEADIRIASAELDAVVIMVENKRGTPIPNLMSSVIDTLELFFSATAQTLKRPLY